MLHHRKFPPVLILLGMAFVPQAFAQQPGDDLKYPRDVHFDFRGKPLPPELTLTPDGSDKFVRSEPEGLRITLPKNRQDLAPVVVGTRYGVKGDFEITATVEILQAEIPKEGFGVGVNLFVNKVDPSTEGATLGRLLRPNGKDVVFWDLGISKGGKEMQYDTDFRERTDKQFRLRLRRVGAKLFYQVGPGLKGDDFEDFDPKTFGTNDLKQVLVRVTTGRQPASVDVRLVELHIRSGAIPAPPVPDADPPAAPPARSWLLAMMCLALAVTLALAVVLGALQFLRKRPSEPAKDQ